MSRIRLLRTLSTGLLGVGAAVITVACAPADETATTTDETYPAAEQSPADPADMDMAAGTGEPATVVDALNEEGSYSTLTQALTEAELTEALSQPGPFTVFAPTDEAFAALPEGTVEQLLLPENRQVLQEVLAYHVTSGAITSDQIATGDVTTLQGETVPVNADGGAVTVGNAQVVNPDVEAGNGVVHGIDTVLLPPDLQL
jgi:uncharacterized surface protein with fasciclin (FAS1) repeats